MNRSITLVFACAAMAFGQQSAAQSGGAMAALVAQDLRLAAIAERILGGNRDLCRQHMPLTGFVLHSRDQYGSDVAGNAFDNGRVAVAGTIPGSAASSVLVPGDGIAAIGQTRTDTLVAEDEEPLRDSAFDVIAGQPDGVPLTLAVVHDGREQAIPLDVPSGCRALVEIRATSGINARSDGRVIQVNYGLAAAASDDELAVVFAHE